MAPKTAGNTTAEQAAGSRIGTPPRFVARRSAATAISFAMSSDACAGRKDLQGRPVHDSSGWIHVDTDLWSIHEYTQDPVKFRSILASPPPKHTDGREGQPLLVAEYAGVGYDAGGPYGKNPTSFIAGYPGRPGLPKDQDDALSRIGGLTAEICAQKGIAGYCCTQLYDVEFEKNGLLTYDRLAKYPIAEVKKIFLEPKET